MLLLGQFVYLLHLLLVIADDAPLDGLLLALEFADHALGRVHLLASGLQVGVQLLILLVETGDKGSLH
jgi:hypothetical protein